MPVDYIPTPGYINGELVVGNITHLDINKIGSDVASPVDTLAIYCDTTIGSASNGRDLYVYLDPAKQVVIDGSTQAQTQTGGALYVAVTTATNSAIKAMQVDLVTHDLQNTEWAYGIWVDPDVSAAVSATSYMAAIYLVDPDDTAQCDTFGLYIEAGYDWGIAVLSPVLLSSLVIAPTADPTPYPLDFALEGWLPGTGTAGVYSQGRVINMDYGVARTLDGALAGMYMDFNTNLTVAANVVTGIYMDISTGDEANPSIGISITKDVTADLATRAVTGAHIDLNTTLASYTSGAGATWNDYFVDMDIDLIYNDTAVIFSGGFIDMTLNAPADGLPQVYGDMVRLSIYSVVTNQTLRGFYLNSDVRLNDAAAVHYGMEIDMTGVTLTNYLTQYGLFIQMQAAYGAGADAAIYATGDGNIFAALLGDGVYVEMNEVGATVGIHVVNAADDTVGTTSQGIQVAPTHTVNHGSAIYYGLDVDFTGMAVGTTAGLHGVHIDTTGLALALNVANLALIMGPTTFNGIWIDAGTTDITGQCRIIEMDLDVADTGSTVYGIYMDIDETVAGTSTLTGAAILITAITASTADIMGLLIDLDGDRDSGSGNLYGILVNADFEINHAAERANGIEINMDDVTVGAAGANHLYAILLNMDGMTLTGIPTNFAAMRMDLPASGYGIWIDNATVDVVGAKDIIFLDADVNDPGAAGNVRGINIDIDETALGTDGTFITAYETTMSGFATGQADLAAFKVTFDTTKSSGDNTYGLFVDANLELSDAAENFYGANIDMDGLTNTTSLAALGIFVHDDKGDASSTTSGILVSHDLIAAITADRTNSGQMLELSSVVTNTTAGDFDVTNSVNGMLITMSHTVNHGVATTNPDTFSGTALSIGIDGTTTQATDELTMTTRAVDISYTALQTLGVFILDVTDIFRIDFNVDAGVAIATGGAGDLNIMLLNGDGFVPGATFANNTDVHGIHMDWSSAALGADAQVQSFVGIRIDMPANYGADGGAGGGLAAGNTNAAIYATGNANIFSALIGDGCYIEMGETGATNGLQIVNTATDAAGVTANAIKVAPTYTLNHANAIFYGADFDLSGMTTTLGTIEGITMLFPTDTISAGRTWKGLDINADGVTCGLGQTFYGIHLDMESLTPGGTVYGMYVNVPGDGATGIYVQHDQAGAAATSYGVQVLESFATAAGEVFTKSGGAIQIGKTITNVGAGSSSTYSGDELTTTLTLTQDPAGQVLYSGSFVNLTIVPTNSPQIYGNKVTQQYGAVTVPDAQTLAGYHLSASATIGTTVAATANTYGTHLDLSACTSGAAAGAWFAEFYGVYVQMPGAGNNVWGGGKTAAIYAEGNGITSVILGEIGTNIAAFGVILPAAGPTAFYIDQITNDATTAKDIFFIDIDVGDIGANPLRGMYVSIDETVAGTDGAELIGYQVDITGFDTGRADLLGMQMVFDGEKSGGDETKGLFIDANLELDSATEHFYGVHVDTTGLTLGAAAAAGTLHYGVLIEMPAAYGAATEAAIYATGNANIWSCLIGDGMYIQMGEDSSIFMNMDAPAAWTQGTILNFAWSAAVASLGGGVTGVALDLSTNVTDANDQTVVAMDITMPANVSATSYAISLTSTQDQGAGMFMDLNGTVGAGQTLRGFYIDSTGATCGFGETFYGIDINMGGMGIAGTIQGIHMTLPTSSRGIHIAHVLAADGDLVGTFGLYYDLTSGANTVGLISAFTSDIDTTGATVASGVQSFIFSEDERQFTSWNNMSYYGIYHMATLGGGGDCYSVNGIDLSIYTDDLTINLTLGDSYLYAIHIIVDETGTQSTVDYAYGFRLSLNASGDIRVDTAQYLISIDDAGTIQAGNTGYGYYHASTVTCGAGESYYAMNIDISGMTTGGTIRAMFLEMEATGTAIYIDNATTDIVGAKDIISIDAEVGDVGVGSVRGVFVDIDETVVGTNGTFIRGMQVDITGFSTGRADLEAMRLYLNGTKDAGDMNTGLMIESDLTINHASELFYGIDINLNGMTVGAANATELTGLQIQMETMTLTGSPTSVLAGIRMMLPAAGYGIYIDNATTDVTVAKDLIFVDADIGDIGANTFQGVFIDMDETVVGTNAAQHIAYAATLTGFSTGRADLTGIFLTFDGTKDGGDASYGISIDANQTLNDASELFYGFYVDMSGMTLTSATRAAGIGMVMDAAATNTAIWIDAATENMVEKDLIYADIDCAAITAAAYFRGVYLDIDETAAGNDGSFIHGIQVDMTGFGGGRADLVGVKVVIDGSKTGGDLTDGMFVSLDVTVNNASECLCGYRVDATGITNTLAQLTCGMWVQDYTQLDYHALLQREDTGTDGPILGFYFDSSTVAVNDDIGIIEFRGRNAADNADVIYAEIKATVTGIGGGAETGALEFWTCRAGTSTLGAFVDNLGVFHVDALDGGADPGVAELTVFDSFDDVGLLRDFARRDNIDQFVELGIMTKHPSGLTALNLQYTFQLMAGGIYQNRDYMDEQFGLLNTRFETLEDKVVRLEQENEDLKAMVVAMKET